MQAVKSTRIDRIESNCQHFQPTLLAKMLLVFQVSRKSTSGTMNQHSGSRIVSNRSNQVESSTFSTHPVSQDTLSSLSLAQIDNWYDESTFRQSKSTRIDRIESNRQHFQPTLLAKIL